MRIAFIRIVEQSMDKHNLKRGSIDQLRYNMDIGAKANYFHVEFVLPTAFTASPEAGEAIPNMGMRVEKCDIPGVTVDTTDFSTFGPEYPMVTGVSFDNTVTMSFMCDSNFVDRYIIEAWQSMIFASQKMPEESHDADNFKGTLMAPNFAYPDEYSAGSKIYIYQLRKNMHKKPAMKVTLHDAYPISYSMTGFDRASEESIMNFDVTFGYRIFDTEFSKPPRESALNRGRKFLSAIREGLGVVGRYNKKAKEYSQRLGKLEDSAGELNSLFGGTGRG